MSTYDAYHKCLNPVLITKPLLGESKNSDRSYAKLFDDCLKFGACIVSSDENLKEPRSSEPIQSFIKSSPQANTVLDFIFRKKTNQYGEKILITNSSFKKLFARQSKFPSPNLLFPEEPNKQTRYPYHSERWRTFNNLPIPAANLLMGNPSGEYLLNYLSPLLLFNKEVNVWDKYIFNVKETLRNFVWFYDSISLLCAFIDKFSPFDSVDLNLISCDGLLKRNASNNLNHIRKILAEVGSIGTMRKVNVNFHSVTKMSDRHELLRDRYIQADNGVVYSHGIDFRRPTSRKTEISNYIASQFKVSAVEDIFHPDYTKLDSKVWLDTVLAAFKKHPNVSFSSSSLGRQSLNFKKLVETRAKAKKHIQH